MKETGNVAGQKEVAKSEAKDIEKGSAERWT